MTPGQRRTLWACIFALTFIFWSEASGQALIWDANMPEILDRQVALDHYWSNFAYGFLFLMLGSILSVVLQPQNKADRKPYRLLDWAILSIGLGALAGTAYRSYIGL